MINKVIAYAVIVGLIGYWLYCAAGEKINAILF